MLFGLTEHYNEKPSVEIVLQRELYVFHQAPRVASSLGANVTLVSG